ncbi:hypothetical protein SASPL_108086 [Salvia splendens]|uniref:Uncharacterized protein n=1 Tax=Salvia splendens TaxID=180675 RepID=A0A8X8YG26_SALSN|nr:hypothetical protein SASPL_108086 [Salvia splendens]
MLLYNAALKGDLAKTEQLTDEFPDLIKFTLGFRAETLVHIAAATGNFEYMSNLLDSTLREYALTTLKDISGNNPLHIAALAGSYKVAELLMLRCPLLPYYTNHSSKFPQQCAAECARKLLRQKASELLKTLCNYLSRMDYEYASNYCKKVVLKEAKSGHYIMEADKFVIDPTIRGQKNKNGETTNMIFTREHKGMKEEVEKFLKDTSNSCSIIAAMIVAIVVQQQSHI